jgi:hypothetical protein
MIMRSTDSGATWKELDLSKSGLPESKEGITRSAMTPGNPDDFLVVLAGNGYENTPRVYRTTNGGATSPLWLVYPLAWIPVLAIITKTPFWKSMV